MFARRPARTWWDTASAYDAARFAAGATLLFAGGMKVRQLTISAAFDATQYAIAAFEIGVGVWLASGLFKRWAWLTALVLFSVFSTLSVARFMAGAESCGCFGDLIVPPGYTLLFDLSIVAAFTFCRPPGVLGGRSRALAGLAACVPSLVLVGGGLAMAHQYLSNDLSNRFAPDKWLHSHLALLESIDIGPELSQGQWVILVHSPTCGKCAEVLPKYFALARDFADIPNTPRIALVQVPSNYKSDIVDESGCVIGRLHTTEFKIITPLELTVRDGILTGYRLL